jgi:hypothetical protein
VDDARLHTERDNRIVFYNLRSLILEMGDLSVAGPMHLRLLTDSAINRDLHARRSIAHRAASWLDASGPP